MKLQRVLTWTVPVFSAALILTACDRDRDMGNPPSTTERTTGQRMDDKQLTASVKDALGDNAAYKFPDVKVNAYNGKVQLSGFVATREQKREAEAIANSVVGAENVENKITVKQ